MQVEALQSNQGGVGHFVVSAIITTNDNAVEAGRRPIARWMIADQALHRRYRPIHPETIAANGLQVSSSDRQSRFSVSPIPTADLSHCKAELGIFRV